MRVIKLNEAGATEYSYNELKNLEKQYNEAKDYNTKVNIISNVAQISPDNNLFKFGETFLDRWISAMKWDELARNDNEFVFLLRNLEPVTKDVKTFLKVYNAYADNLFDFSDLSDGHPGPITTAQRDLLVKALNSNNISDDDFSKLFEIYNKQQDQDKTDISKFCIDNDPKKDLKSIANLMRDMGVKDSNKLNNDELQNIVNSIADKDVWKSMNAEQRFAAISAINNTGRLN